MMLLNYFFLILERFNNIFEMMPVWVNKASKIVTDYSVDKETLVNLGYR